ncbi:S24 family peptidase [Sphingomonas gellani]|nr:LexA family transcriptional regulator [Sphingomonas gellani]
MTDLIERLEERLTALGKSDREVSLLATEGRSSDLIRDLRRGRGKRMGIEAYQRLAEALETTVSYLRDGVHAAEASPNRRTGYESHAADRSFDEALPRTIPVYGTALGAELDLNGDELVESHIVELTEAIDWVRRPPLLARRSDVYAVYITGSSMEPRFEPGDPVIVDPKRPPRPGDDVIVQLADRHTEGAKAALIKRLVRRSAKALTLRQYNPPMDFEVAADEVLAVHRVVMMRDLLG